MSFRPRANLLALASLISAMSGRSPLLAAAPSKRVGARRPDDRPRHLRRSRFPANHSTPKHIVAARRAAAEAKRQRKNLARLASPVFSWHIRGSVFLSWVDYPKHGRHQRAAA